MIWKIFGNDEDPIPPEWYLPEKKMCWREFMWFIVRNPLHNFTWHIIGIVNKSFSVKYLNYKNWYCHILMYKRFIFPFISYNGKRCVFYIGWRKNGAFGIKINPAP
ncbi:MAG: hypothetical protein AB1478_02685 [Nitrospirota bacterium]